MGESTNHEIRPGYGGDDWEFELAGHLLGTVWEGGVDGHVTITQVKAMSKQVGDNEFTVPVLHFEGLRDVWPPDGIQQGSLYGTFNDASTRHSTTKPFVPFANQPNVSQLPILDSETNGLKRRPNGTTDIRFGL